MSSPTDFPLADAVDPDDVAAAIDAGRNLWDKGERREAVRWLRKAAERASSGGHKARAQVLARAAADLSVHVEPQPPAHAVRRAQPQLAKDPDGDFSDKTVVDEAPQEAPAADRDARDTDPAMSAAKPIAERQCLRVAVDSSGSDSRGLTVRVLAEGQPLPPDMHEALLVSLEPGTDLTRRR